MRYQIYLIGMAFFLIMGVIALSIGSLNNVTGAFSVDKSGASLGSFHATPLELKVYKFDSSNHDNECELTLYSGTEDIIQETGSHAVEAYSGNPAWTANIPGAKWIWKSYYVENPSRSETYTFVREFNWTGLIDTATLVIASDNSYQVTLNGFPVGMLMSGNNHAASRTHSVSKVAINQGKNILKIKVKNFAGSSDPKINTAGLLYKLELKKADCPPCETRITCRKMYNFNDTKPGDKGLDIFRLDVSGSNAWVCLFIENKDDLENGLIDPERESGDTTAGAKKGELSEYLQVFGWFDEDEDSEYSPGDTYLFKGSLSAKKPAFSIADSIGSYNIPVQAGKKKYLGIFWCFGEIKGTDTYSLWCDGSGSENNKAQTDIMKADFTFYAAQSDGNPNFKCNKKEII